MLVVYCISMLHILFYISHMCIIFKFLLYILHISYIFIYILQIYNATLLLAIVAINTENNIIARLSKHGFYLMLRNDN